MIIPYLLVMTEKREATEPLCVVAHAIRRQRAEPERGQLDRT